MVTSIRLPEEVDTRLVHLCAVTKRSKSFYIKEALVRYLEEVADYYIAADRLTKPGRLLTGEQLLSELEAEQKK